MEQALSDGEVTEKLLAKYREQYINKVLVFGATEDQRTVLRTIEIDFDPNQKARVVDINVQFVNEEGHDHMVLLTVDFSEFEERNKTLARPEYFDDYGAPRLKWHETKYYPEDKRSTLYVGENEPVPFAIESDGKALAPVIISPSDWNLIVDTLLFNGLLHVLKDVKTL